MAGRAVAVMEGDEAEELYELSCDSTDGWSAQT
jgi:hypothetical protein